MQLLDTTTAHDTASPHHFPSLEELVDRLLGTPHQGPESDCWTLVQQLYQDGRGLRFDPHIARNTATLFERWWRDDAVPVETRLRPWDILILNTGGPFADHLGVVVNATQFVHSRPATGVVLEPIARWRRYILQVAATDPPTDGMPPPRPVHIPPLEAGPDTARCLCVLSPLPDMRGRLHTESADVPAGQPLAAYLPRHQAVTASINGGVIPPEQYATRIVQPGEEILLKPDRLGFVGGLVGILIGIAISIAVGLATAYLTQILFPPQRPKFGEQDESTYGWEGIRTTVGSGAKVPVIYGRHRVGGQLLQASVEMELAGHLITDGVTVRITAGDITPRPRLLMLLALGEGEIQGVEGATVELNGQPIANFPGVVMDARHGTAGQAALPRFTETRNSFADGREITGGTIIYTTTAAVTAYVLTISFPEGLVRFTDKGDKASNRTDIVFQHRVSPAGAWSPINGLSVRASKTSVVRAAVRRDALPSAVYDIRLQYVTSGTTAETARWRPFLESVTEVQAGTETYPGTALLGLEAVATENLSGAIPNTTAVIQGMKVRVGSFVAAPAFSQNPAWCLMDFLTNTRYGLGIPDTEINLPAFITYAAYCDEIVDSEVRHRLDYVLTDDAEAAILHILTSSRAVLYKFQGLYTPLPLRDEAPVQLISWANCTNVRLAYTRDPDRINVMEGRFADESDDWEQGVITWPTEANWPAQVRKSTIDLRGMTRRSAVMRALQYELNRRRLPKLTLQMECSMDALALTANGIFRFAHPLPGWGVSGRIQSGSTTTSIRLDEAVTFLTGKTYHLYVRHEDDTVETRAVVHPGASTTTTVTLALALSQVPQPLTSLYAFGENSPLDTAVRLFRATRVARLTDQTLRLQAVQHVPSIDDDPIAEPLPNTDLLFNPLGPPPPLSALVLTDLAHIGADGHSYPVVNLSWDVGPLTTDYAPYGGAIILRREVGGGAIAGTGTLGEVVLGETQPPGDVSADFQRIATVGPSELEYDDPLVLVGLTYEYKVVPVSVRQVPNNNGTVSGVIHVGGGTTILFIPGTPPNLRLKGQAPGDGAFEGPDIHLEWDAVGGPLPGVLDPDIVEPDIVAAATPAQPLYSETYFVMRYRIEIWAPGQAYRLRQDTVLAPKGITTPLSYVYTRDMNAEDQAQAGASGPRRDVQVFVWAVSNEHRESLVPASITVTNPPPDMSSIAPRLTGIIDAMVLDWAQFVEPRDLAHYAIYLDPTPAVVPTTLLQTLPAGQQHLLLPDLHGDTTYVVQILPHDTFGPGIATPVVQATTRSILSLSELFVRQFFPSGIAFSADPETNIVSWTSGTLGYVATSTTKGSQPIAAGSATWGGRTLYIYYEIGQSVFQTTISLAIALGQNKAVMAVYNGGTNLVILFGKAIVHGSDILANTIGANQLVVDTAIITTAAQIANAIIDDAHITSLSADKITAGTIDVEVALGAGNITMEAPNDRILVVDDQAPPQTRVVLGKLDGTDTAWGIQVFNAAGALMFDADGDGINTDGIVAEAVTAVRTSSDSGAVGIGPTETVVLSLSNVPTTSAQVVSLRFQAVIGVTTNEGFTLRFRRGSLTGTLLRSVTYGFDPSAGTVPLVEFEEDTGPGAPTEDYVVTIQALVTNTVNLSNRRFVAQTFRR